MRKEHLAAILALAALPLLASCDGGSSDHDRELDADLHDADATEEESQSLSPLACLTDAACDTVMVTSHRGYHKHHPENSLAAIRGAAELGAEFVEIDVRHTSDEIVVLMHDDTLDRTTDGTGAVSDHSWAEIQQLTLTGGETGNPESTRVPSYHETMELARELGIMLYLDQKTERTDLVLAEIQAGSYHDVNLIRDDMATVIAQAAEDPELLVMPSISSEDDLAAVLAAIAALHIVEVGFNQPAPALVSAIRASGIKVQQDLLGASDIRAVLGDYKGWKAVIETGVYLPQTDLPNLLVPAVREFNRTGVFPEEGPADMP